MFRQSIPSVAVESSGAAVRQTQPSQRQSAETSAAIEESQETKRVYVPTAFFKYMGPNVKAKDKDFTASLYLCLVGGCSAAIKPITATDNSVYNLRRHLSVSRTRNY